jgi:hypothetical protein
MKKFFIAIFVFLATSATIFAQNTTGTPPAALQTFTLTVKHPTTQTHLAFMKVTVTWYNQSGKIKSETRSEDGGIAGVELYATFTCDVKADYVIYCVNGFFGINPYAPKWHGYILYQLSTITPRNGDTVTASALWGDKGCSSCVGITDPEP